MKDLSRPVLFTPENITSLQPNEIFVFGSNIFGHNSSGAAATAVKRFGAHQDVYIGQEGQSYAFPTLGYNLKDIASFVASFIKYAVHHLDLIFYVTPIGCGSAGFTAKEIASLFQQTIHVKNIILSKSFVDILCHNEVEMPRYLKTKLHGQFRTLVDVLIELNKQYHYTKVEDAIRGLNEFYEDFQRQHNGITFNAVYRVFINHFIPIFQAGKLDLEQLEQMISSDHFEVIDKIVQEYSMEKLITTLKTGKYGR